MSTSALEAADDTVTTPVAAPAGQRKLWFRAGLGALALATVAAGAWFWHQSSLYVSSTNAYVNANVVRVAPQVTGQVVELPIRNNQTVKAGELLAVIDPQPFQLALAQAEAQLAQVREQSARARVSEREAGADIARNQAELEQSRRNAGRMQELLAKHYIAPDMADKARTAVTTGAALVTVAEAKREEARLAISAAAEQEKAAQALVDQARLDLSRTRIVATASGRIANLNLRPGSTVTAHQPAFSLITDDEFWLDANLKETEMAGVKPGQPVDVKVDMYPGRVFKAHVESISGGAGTAFSLLPPQNASGNWVKVTQRVPVRIRVDQVSAEAPLVIGTSAEVKILRAKV